MFDRTFGPFLGVLVEMDLTQQLRHIVLVERKNFAFFIELDYKHIPMFCTHCKMLRHGFDSCNKVNVTDGDENNRNKSKQKVAAIKIFI